MEGKFVCPVCKNEDPKYIGYKNGKPYCRKCISFKGEEADKHYQIKNKIKLDIKYTLTPEQIRISNELVSNFKNKCNQLIRAVCGSGKTELVFQVIEYAIKNKMRVGFSIPRKDVVRELALRFQKAFPKANIISLYGGNTDVLEGDLICLTTHQLYRFVDYFDLLIIDEIDAFPYANNEVLYEMFKRSVRGNFILMSATPSDSFVKKFLSNTSNKLLELNCRYHMQEIPVPIIRIIPTLLFKILFIVSKLYLYKKENKPCLIFVPTIELSEKVYFLLKNLVKPGYFVNSHSPNRNEIIDDFRIGNYLYLVTTAVLERGVTLRNLQVIIFNADNKIYNTAVLVQITGRVGRVLPATKGDVYFIGDTKTKDMEQAIKQTNYSNECLHKLLQGK